jgi:hypothetical protein
MTAALDKYQWTCAEIKTSLDQKMIYVNPIGKPMQMSTRNALRTRRRGGAEWGGASLSP